VFSTTANPLCTGSMSHILIWTYDDEVGGGALNWQDLNENGGPKKIEDWKIAIVVYTQ